MPQQASIGERKAWKRWDTSIGGRFDLFYSLCSGGGEREVVFEEVARGVGLEAWAGWGKAQGGCLWGGGGLKYSLFWLEIPSKF